MAGTVARLCLTAAAGDFARRQAFSRHLAPLNPTTMKRFFSSLPLVALLSGGVALAGGEGWSNDYAASCKQAAEAKKDLLIDFTGSDWCGWCIKLNKEVFSHDEFKAGVKDNFVLVELDYPRDKSKLSEATLKQNEELGKKYSVAGYPTILLCDAGGKPYAATGYEEGGPGKYVEHLDTLRKKKAIRDEAFAAASKANGVEKAKALVAALKAMELNDGLVASFYGSVADEIKAADPKDETGFTKAAASKARMETFNNELNAFAEKEDHAGALAHVDKTLKEGGFGKEETQQIMMMRCMIYAQQEKLDDAIKAADEAKAFDPESERNAQIDGFIAQLTAAKAKAAAKAGDKTDDEADAGEDEEESDKASDPN